MAAERDLELLDDYLANRLSEQERSAFEQKINNDAELKSELQLQQQFINGIRKARVAELKTMLNNIPVPAGPSSVTATGTKITLWITAAGIVGAGLYLYLRNDEATELPVDPVQNEKIQEPSSNNDQPTSTPGDESPEVSDQPSSSEQRPAEPPKAVEKNDREKETSKEPKIEVFDPTEENADGANSTIEELDNVQFREKQSPSIAVDIESQDKKYNFHYQFKNGRLVLYGPFEKNLYEIMEFFNDDKRTIFLYYKDEYFLLKEDNNKLKPLNAIEDPALVKKLREYRN